ncbi:MAG: recombination protein RecR [Candidatus Delongbacteria bacterium]|nr:recombination protein RecR [Candidatus Delongbacteria bacterium]
MKISQSEILENLINNISKLPGIGKKSARRIAYYLINTPEQNAISTANSIIEAREKLGLCKECFNLSEDSICNICTDISRNKEIILVIENFHDLYLFEKLNIHKGVYHVLGGLLNPLDGIGPAALRLDELFNRVKENNISELIIGLNHSIEGDSTSLYISNRLNTTDVKISRLASGIPVGGEIEYTDEITLKQAFENRK